MARKTLMMELIELGEEIEFGVYRYDYKTINDFCSKKNWISPDGNPLLYKLQEKCKFHLREKQFCCYAIFYTMKKR